MPLVKTHFSDSELYHDLKAMGRDNFSYEGAKALMEHLQAWAGEYGTNIEYDPVALCCDFAEYTEDELISEYGYLLDDENPEIGDLVETLGYETQVIEFPGGYIVQAF